MRNNYNKHRWLAIKIWLIAVIANDILGTIYLSGFVFQYRNETALEYLKLGIVWGAIFSLPVMLILLYALRHCIDSNMTGWSLFRYIIVTSLLLTCFMFIVFCAVISVGATSILLVLLAIALLSGVIGIASQYSALLKCGSDYQN